MRVCVRFISVVLVLIGLFSCSTSPAQQESIEGLWLWTANQPDKLRDVQIERKQNTWRAVVNGQPAEVEAANNQLLLKAPLEEQFNGYVDSENQEIVGWWRQPSSDLAYSTMVTRVTFSASGEQKWEGRFNAQDRPFRVYLDVFNHADDGLFAAIRNPERNEMMWATRFRVEEIDAQRWSLVAGSGERARRYALQRVDGGLELEHTWFDEPLRLRRANNSDRVGYDPSDLPRRYTPPPQLEDGWGVADAGAVGFDPTVLDRMVADIAASDPRSRRPRLLHGVLASYQGELVLEEYFYGYDRNTPHDTRSLGKVFAPVLVGALQQRGVSIDANDRPIEELLDASGEPLDDPRKRDITLGQLMSFTSGLDCDVTNPNSRGNEDQMWGQSEEPNFWMYAAKLPLLHEPGSRYAYCSASINLAGASIEKAGGDSIQELFHELIATPLQFGDYHWNLAPNGKAYLGGGPYLLPRDILKIGAMHAAGGLWNEQRVLPAEWVSESTTPVMQINPQTTGMDEDTFNNNYFGGAAGYEWRMDRVILTADSYMSYEASGNGGQVLIVVPELELAVLFMGGNYRHGSVWGRWRNEIIGGYLIPALKNLED